MSFAIHAAWERTPSVAAVDGYPSHSPCAGRMLPSTHPERMGSTQPRVARNALPWVGVMWSPTLKGLKPRQRPSQSVLLQPLQGWAEGKPTQGRRCYANPGLSDHNPVGVEVIPKPVNCVVLAWLLACLIGGLFVCVGGSPLSAQERPYHQWSSHLTHADVDFFFESVTLKNGECQFKLTANTLGMLWRIRTNKTDLTGACQSGQMLSLPASASLEIKRKDLNLYFLPQGPGAFNVRFVIKTESDISKETESREATILRVKGNGGYDILIGED